MISFFRNSRPYRIAAACITMATIYLVYISFHFNDTEPSSHHRLIGSKVVSLKLLEARILDGEPGAYSPSGGQGRLSANATLYGSVYRDARRLPESSGWSSTPRSSRRDRRWVQSQVTKEIVYLDNSTLHKNPPTPPMECNTQSKMSELLAMEPIQFLPNYKNPCWEESIDVPVDDLYNTNGFLHYSASYKKVFKKLKAIFKSQKSSSPVRIRCLPYFFLSGQPKCGSTDLYNKLVLHPQIATPPTKESHWWGKNRYGWCLNYSRPIPFDDYVDLYDFPSIEIQSITEGSLEHGQDFHPVITGDASVSTLWSNDDWWTNPENCGLTEPLYTNAHHLHRILPGARIIVILRNPTDRLYSDYLYFRNYKSISDFHQVAAMAIQRLNECFETMGIRSCVYNATVAYGSRLRLRIGLYHVFLQEWMAVFPREQILVVRLEDYAREPLETMMKVHKFLGLKTLSEEEQHKVLNQPKSNTRRVRDKRLGNMMNETRELLNNFYRPFNIKLARLLNDPGYLWEQ